MKHLTKFPVEETSTIFFFRSFLLLPLTTMGGRTNQKLEEKAKECVSMSQKFYAEGVPR